MKRYTINSVRHEHKSTGLETNAILLADEHGAVVMYSDAEKLAKENAELKINIDKAWAVIKRANYENFYINLRKFMEGE